MRISVMLNSMIQKIKFILNTVDKFILPFFAISPILASLYYCFFSRRFWREHQSVLRGRISYWKELKYSSHTSVLLRRNIHRLEKGIIMRPRRDVFALDYIDSTVVRFNQCNTSGLLNSAEKIWAEQVLRNYFEVVKSPLVNDARSMFFDSVLEESTPLSSVPYLHSDIVKSTISYSDFKQLCVQRRSVRWFKDTPVPLSEVKKALEAATLAPSACNRQPFEFYVFNDPDDAKKIGGIPMGTAGFSHNFQCVVVVVGNLASYPYERDRHVIYIDASLAAMQFMLALETIGLSSCVINWPDVEALEREMIDVLKLKMEQRPVMLISLGYADGDGMIPFSQKKSAEDLIKVIDFDN